MEKPRRRIAPWKWAIATVVVTVGTGVVALYVAEAITDAAIDQELKKLRALGYMVSIAEYDARRPKDVALDAAPLYAEADRFIERNPALNLVGAGSITSLSTEKVEGFVRGAEHAYHLIITGANRRNCTPEKPWEGLGFMFPNERIVYPCFVYARWKSEQGDWRGALSDISTGRRVGAQVHPKDGSGYSAAASVEVESLQVFALVATRHRNQSAFLRSARAWLAALPPPPRHHEYYEDDLIHKRHLLKDPTFMQQAGNSAARSNNERWLARLAMGTPLGRKQVEARFLRLLRERIDPVPKDPWEDHEWRAAMIRRLDSETSLVGRIAGAFINDYWWTHRTPGTAAATTRRLADVALWVLEQAHATGKLPDQLPHEPRFIDPWTQEPYRLIKNGTGFTIRSIGPNNRDEGGPMTETRVNSDDEELVIPPVPR